MKCRHLLATSAIALAVAAPASAATIDLVSVTGTWVSITGGVGTAGAGTDTISWGSEANRSSYVFEGAAPPAKIGLMPNAVFDLGEFTHNNFPIPTGSGITGARLRVDYTLAIPTGGAMETFTSFFDFAHFETPNSAEPCADGGPNGVGVNINGCADRVTVTTDFTGSQSVMIGDETFFLTITGFGINGDVDFWTIEGQENSIVLQAAFRSEVNVIPLPAAGWMLVTALGGLGIAANRRRRKAA